VDLIERTPRAALVVADLKTAGRTYTGLRVSGALRSSYSDATSMNGLAVRGGSPAPLRRADQDQVAELPA
jgi:hypothetical protein